MCLFSKPSAPFDWFLRICFAPKQVGTHTHTHKYKPTLSLSFFLSVDTCLRHTLPTSHNHHPLCFAIISGLSFRHSDTAIVLTLNWGAHSSTQVNGKLQTAWSCVYLLTQCFIPKRHLNIPEQLPLEDQVDKWNMKGCEYLRDQVHTEATQRFLKISGWQNATSASDKRATNRMKRREIIISPFFGWRGEFCFCGDAAWRMMTMEVWLWWVSSLRGGLKMIPLASQYPL